MHLCALTVQSDYVKKKIEKVAQSSIADTGQIMSKKRLPGAVSMCCNGKIKKTGNYEFRYGEANEVAVLEGEIWKKVDMTNLHN